MNQSRICEKKNFVGKMRIFQRIQRQYAILGIRPSKRWLQNDLPFNGRIALGFSLFACLICSQFVYIIYVANDFMEYIECICSVSGAIITFVCFAAVVYRRTTLFDGIGDIEKLIDTSKTLSSCYFIHDFVITILNEI